MPPGLSDQGRHPGDADRRGHDRKGPGLKILIVRLRLIGDVVFTTPIVRALRRRYPDAHITYAVEAEAAGVVAGNPHLNEVLIVPRRRGMRRVADDWRMAGVLRGRRFDLVIDLHGGPRASWLTWATGAPHRIGYLAPGRGWMYTQTVPRPADRQPRHAVINQWEIIAALGVPHGSPTEDPVEMPDVPGAGARVERILSDAGMTPGGALIVLHVSAGNRFRRWPPDHFVALVTALARRDSRRRFVLTSGPSDGPAAEELVRRINSASAVPAGTVVHAQFAVDELRALAARASLYIGGDSGPLHIAATTRTPIVALFGSTLPERSVPWRDPQWFVEAVDAGPLPCRPCRQRTCAPGDFRCLTQIAPERVEAAAERALRTEDSGTVVDETHMASLSTRSETGRRRTALA